MGRKKEDRVRLDARVARTTPERIRKLAEQLGYEHASKGSPGKFLDAIANGELLLYKKVDNSQ